MSVLICCMSVKESWTDMQALSWLSELDTISGFEICKLRLNTCAEQER